MSAFQLLEQRIAWGIALRPPGEPCAQEFMPQVASIWQENLSNEPAIPVGASDHDGDILLDDQSRRELSRTGTKRLRVFWSGYPVQAHFDRLPLTQHTDDVAAADPYPLPGELLGIIPEARCQHAPQHNQDGTNTHTTPV